MSIGLADSFRRTWRAFGFERAEDAVSHKTGNRIQPSPQPQTTELLTNLAPLLFEKVQVEQQLVVLNIGLATAATVELFSSFKCKLIFVDLYSDPLFEGLYSAEGSLFAEGSLSAEGSLYAEGSLSAEGSLLTEGSEPSPTHQQLVEGFTAALKLDPRTKIDICLFWDFFNYLDGTLLKAFIEALHPHISDSTCGYGLGVLNGRRQLPNYEYGLKRLDTLSQCPRDGVQKPVYPHSQRDLNNLLGYFDIDKSRLMPDGRVEYLLSQGVESKFVKKSVF